jgi:ketosteroid isomerase-like protein
MNNLEIVRNTYTGTAEENAARLAACLAENVIWTEAKGFPYAGTYIGFDAIVANVFKRLATEWIDYKVTIEGCIADGDTVAAYGTYSGTYKLTNRYFEARVVHLWRLKGGKVISMEQFVDSQMVNNAIYG